MVARRAGLQQASTPVNASSAGTPTMVGGSYDETPQGWLPITRPSNSATASPMAIPAPTSFKPLRITIPSTLPRSAPRAVRMPISCVYRAVTYAMTL